MKALSKTDPNFASRFWKGVLVAVVGALLIVASLVVLGVTAATAILK